MGGRLEEVHKNDFDNTKEQQQKQKAKPLRHNTLNQKSAQANKKRTESS